MSATAIDPTDNIIRLSPQRIDIANQLLQWCWVIKLKRFVLIDDPTINLTEEQFNDTYADAMPQSSRGRGPSITPSSYVRDEHRETRVVHRMEMLPTDRQQIVTDKYGLPVLNLYRPSREPVMQDGSVKPVLDHLRWILNHDEEAYRHLLLWIAHLVFRPEQRIHHGIVISGHQGTGKSTIGEIVSALLGSSVRKIQPRFLKGDFHDWMLNTRFAIVEELKEMGNETLYNAIKPYFTDDKLHINPKGLPSFDITNHLHFMMFSNHPYPMALEEGDRRLFYVHSEVRKRDAAYYAALHREIFKEGGLKAFYRYLRDDVLPGIPRDFAFLPPPRTQNHEAWVAASLNPIETHILDCRAESEDDQPGTSPYAPETICHWNDLKQDLSKDYGHILRNTTVTESVLKKCGIVKDRRTIDGKKLTVCWFDTHDAGIRMILGDTSHAGRQRLREHLWKPACPQL
jgi:hypothetical protein